MNESMGLGQVFGRRLKEARGALSQDQVARRARAVGLSWTKAVVLAFENGRREDVSLTELLLISKAFDMAPAEWFEGDEWVQIGPEAQAKLDAIRDLLSGKRPTLDARRWRLPFISEVFQTIRQESRLLADRATKIFGEPDPPAMLVLSAQKAAAGEAERRIARRLNADPLDVSLAAFKLWGHSFTDEREARLSGEGDVAKQRGHVSRKLMTEVKALLEDRKGP